MTERTVFTDITEMIAIYEWLNAKNSYIEIQQALMERISNGLRKTLGLLED